MPALTALKLTSAGAITSTGVNSWVVVPSPNWPLPLKPQQYAAPAAVTPQVWRKRALTAAKLTPGGAFTSTGVNSLFMLPSPSCPLALSPQQYAAPAAVSPQVWKKPALTALKAGSDGWVGPVSAPQPSRSAARAAVSAWRA